MPSFFVGDSPKKSRFRWLYAGKYIAENGTKNGQRCSIRRTGPVLPSRAKQAVTPL